MNEIKPNAIVQLLDIATPFFSYNLYFWKAGITKKGDVT